MRGLSKNTLKDILLLYIFWYLWLDLRDYQHQAYEIGHLSICKTNKLWNINYNIVILGCLKNRIVTFYQWERERGARNKNKCEWDLNYSLRITFYKQKYSNMYL